MKGRLYRVVADYRAAYPDPIVITAGERIQVGESDRNNPAWVWCTGSSGKGGWVPAAYVRRDGDVGVALRDYSATELSVRVGEGLTGLDDEAGWAWARNERGQLGWVPLENVVRA